MPNQKDLFEYFAIPDEDYRVYRCQKIKQGMQSAVMIASFLFFCDVTSPSDELIKTDEPCVFTSSAFKSLAS